MSSVEVVGGAGVVPAGERVGSQSVTVENIWVGSPDRPADAELSLRSMEVYIPTEPVSINGTLYNVAVDQDNLKMAINEVAEDDTGLSYLYPRQLVVGMGWGKALAEIGEDLQPKITDPGSEHRTPILTAFEGEGTSVNITIPRELTSEDYSEAGLVELVTRQANKDLWVALSQNNQAKRKFKFGLRMSSLVVAMGTGEGVGIALANTWYERIGYGLGGVAIGAGAVVYGGLGSDKLRWGSKKNLPSWAIKQSRGYKKIDWKLEELPKEGSVISLEPVQAEQV